MKKNKIHELHSISLSAIDGETYETINPEFEKGKHEIIFIDKSGKEIKRVKEIKIPQNITLEGYILKDSIIKTDRQTKIKTVFINVEKE